MELSNALLVKGLLRLDDGDFEAAAGILRDCLAIIRDTGDEWGAAECLERLAEIELALKLPARAVQFMAAADAARTHGGWLAHLTEDPADRERRTAVARSMLSTEDFSRCWAVGQSIPLSRAVDLALESRYATSPRETASGLATTE